MAETPTARTIDGRALAGAVLADVERGVADLRSEGHVVHLVAVQVGHNGATDVYVHRQKERLSPLGIQFTHLRLDETVGADPLLTHVRSLGENPTVTGIVLTLPLPEGLSAPRIQEAIPPAKDVEGVHPENLGRLVYDRHAVGPCTALAVLRAIESTGIELEGKHAVVVGHSDIVGKPVGFRLLQELATVTTCHIATRDLASHTRKADILVVAVGKPRLIRADMVKPGAVVIDVGINRLAGGKIVGDVAHEEVARVAGWITPVPGGIGPVTVAMLARNALICARRVAGREG